MKKLIFILLIINPLSAFFAKSQNVITNNNNQFYEKDAIYANRKPENELVERRDNSSIPENTPQPKSGTRSTTIYSQDFDAVNTGSLTTSNSQQDGWLIKGTYGAVGAYYHYFGIHSGGYAISSRSLGLSFYQSSGSSLYSTFGTQFTNCSYDTRFDLQAYRSISTAGYENIEVSFDWKCAGENYSGWVDYGQVGYSLNGGSSFTWINTGGSGSGLYHSQTSTQSATVSFPAIIDDNSNFVLAFRAKADECGGNQPAFIIDNIVVTGDVLAGPPSCATPISPLNGASGTAHSGNLEWEAVGGADTYDVYFGTSATPPQVATDQVATTYPLDCLLPETTYYWKVVPKNGDGSATGCATWSFTTDNKLHIYKNDWETASEGYFGTSGTSVDGWYANSISGNAYGYKNVWTVGTGTYAIDGKSVGVTAMQYEALAASHFMYWEDLGTIYRWIYRPFDMTELRDIEVIFDWRCGGENGQDFGNVASSINGGTNWLTDDQGGLYNDGEYFNSPTTIQTESIILPESRNNQSDFQLAFKWNDLSGNGNSSYPSFVVDNIVIRACPYEGYLSSPDQTEPFAWAPPTANTTTTISVNETHDCAYFEWEQSTDNGNTWTVIPGETNVSYTTPSDITSNTYYRCRVYFGTGCPGAYQSEAFKIVFEPECTTAISPLDGATNQSTDVTISWDADSLATDYDIYFGEDNPSATLLDNTASTMDEVQIQISEDVTFPGSTVFDGTFTGSFSGENNFQTSLSGDVLDNTEFPQPFDSDILVHGYSAPTTVWFAPESNTPIAYTATGGNPGGRVGYEGNWNHNPDPWAAGWSNFLRLPEIDASGMDEITLRFDVWHSYFATHPNDKLYLSAWADGGSVNLPQTVKIDGTTVTASANTGGGSYAFYFTEERTASNIEVTLDISGITDKSSILLYINARCDYYNSNLFYVYFDNISVTGADQEFTPGTTYYARARGKVGGSWTDWTSDTYSFTYKDQASIEWHQTAEPQLKTNTLSDVITQSGPDLATIEETVPPANPFGNPSFETSGDWDTYLTGGSELNITLSDGLNWQSEGSKAARMYMWGGYALSSDVAIISQTVDLTDVEQITFDAYSHYGPNFGSSLANGGTLRLIIGGTSNNTTGTVYETINHCVSGSSSCSVESLDNTVTIDPADRTTNQVVKFVWTGFSSGDLGGALVSFQVDNIRVGDMPTPPGTADGTLTTTPINLFSFYGDDIWNELSWDQTLNGGTISMSIEEDNGGTWTPIAGLTDITEIGDGVKTIDISTLGSTSRIRLVTEFTESGAKGTQPELNNWTITSKKDTPLPVTLLYFNLECNVQSKEFNWSTATEINNHYFIIQESDNAIDFYDIGKVYGAGNSSTQNDYEFQVSNIEKKYYRLKQVDYDGTHDYSQIITANCESNYGDISVFPNPFDGETININSDYAIDNSEVIITDISGRELFTKELNINRGVTQINLNKKHDSGTYLFIIKSDKKRIIFINKLFII